MNKEEIMERYGEAAWAEVLAQRRAYYKAHREEERARSKKYKEEHPEEVIADNTRNNQEQNRKGGKRYAKNLEDNRTGLRGDRSRIRVKHANQYKPYKAIIAPDSQIHHEWVPRTPEYRGLALVEKDAHMHGFVNVIEILDGKITLLTEEEVKNSEENQKVYKDLV